MTSWYVTLLSFDNALCIERAFFYVRIVWRSLKNHPVRTAAIRILEAQKAVDEPGSQGSFSAPVHLLSSNFGAA